MDKKYWWQSRTIWFNTAMAVVAFSAEIGPLLAVVEPSTADTVRPFLLMLGAFGNVILRVLTEKPIK